MSGQIPILVGFDPSLRCSGAAGVTLDGELSPVLASALRTRPTTSRGDWFLLRQLDDLKAGRQVYGWALGVLEEPPAGYFVAAVAMEVPSGIPTSFVRPKPGEAPRPKGWRPPQDAQAFGKLVRGGQAVYDAAAEAWGRDVAVVSTYAAKEAATGSKRPKGGKAEVERSVRRLFGPEALDALVGSMVKDEREAVADALAVCLGAMASVPVRAAIQEHAIATAASAGSGGPEK